MDATQAIRTARNLGGFTRDSQFGLVTVQGRDATRFLDSQFPADVNSLDPGHGQLTSRLDRRGRVQCLVIIIPRPEGYWLLTYRKNTESLRDDLERFHIREDVSIEVPDDVILWDVTGPGLPTMMRETFGVSVNWDPYVLSTFEVEGSPVQFLSHPWTGALAGHLVVCQDQHHTLWNHLSKSLGDWVEIDTEAAALLLMEGGWPRGDDLGDRALIAELGREDTMVSFTKGCYLGQETVARVHTRGKVQRHFVGVWGDGTRAFPPGALVVNEGTTVGEITRSIWSPSLERVIGFAWIKRLFSEPGTVVHVMDHGNLRPATLCELPFYQRPSAGEESARFHRQGMEAFQRDAFQEARGLFEKAVLLNPSDLDAYEAMGVCFERMGDLEEATRVMEELRDMAPDHAMAWTNLSRYYAQQGKILEAEEAKGKATYLGWKRSMGATVAKGKAQDQALKDQAKAAERLELFKQVLELDTLDVVANFGLGKLYLDLGELSLAEPLLRKAIEMKREYSMAYNHLATCLIALDRREDALEVLKQGIEVAGRQGDLMPKRNMEQRLLELGL